LINLQADWVKFFTKRLETLDAALENCRAEEGLLGIDFISKESVAVQAIKDEIRRIRLQRAQVPKKTVWLVSRDLSSGPARRKKPIALLSVK
jgi:hypothetical protein